MSNDKILSYLGLCRKAGKLICGTDPATDAIRHGKAVMALTAADASDNTKKRIGDACRYRGIDCAALPFTCQQAGAAVGKSGGIASYAITDPNFADMIKKLL